jgi:hypothetical protein
MNRNAGGLVPAVLADVPDAARPDVFHEPPDSTGNPAGTEGRQ